MSGIRKKTAVKKPRKKAVRDWGNYPERGGDEPAKPLWMTHDAWKSRGNKYKTRDESNPCAANTPKVHYTQNGTKAYYWKKDKAGKLNKVWVAVDGRLAKLSAGCPDLRDAREADLFGPGEDDWSGEERKERANNFEVWLERKKDEKADNQLKTVCFPTRSGKRIEFQAAHSSSFCNKKKKKG
jgi:hypothetical protein